MIFLFGIKQDGFTAKIYIKKDEDVLVIRVFKKGEGKKVIVEKRITAEYPSQARQGRLKQIDRISASVEAGYLLTALIKNT